MEQEKITLPVQPDEWRINIHDAWQVLWWCRYLGLTKNQLEVAIKAVGPVIFDLKKYLTVQNSRYGELPTGTSIGSIGPDSRPTINRPNF